MCGIVGFVDFNSNSSVEVLARMVRSLKYRGPDDAGISMVLHNGAQIGLGHSRLSILDLSPSGHQPMCYRDCSITYNGEVYNYGEIRKVLREMGHIFETQSDTEVILHAYTEWGLRCVDHFIGMFAFVIYDRKLQKLILVRDRIGVKPLYYFWYNEVFLFASELKAFHLHNDFTKEIDVSSLNSYFNFGYIPAPDSIFRNTYKVEPGHYLVLDLAQRKILIEEYWNSTEFYQRDRLEISYSEAKEKLHDLLRSSYNYRMISDVPVGIFLSGGYDSSSVAAITQTETSSKLKTFTIGFFEGNNEAPSARRTAHYLGTEHHEHYCTIKDAQAIIPELPYYYDEPFADSSAIPTILMSNFAGQSVKVVLSADGGDELFVGYDIYSKLYHHIERLSILPDFARSAFGYLSRKMTRHFPYMTSQLRHRLDIFSESMNGENVDMPHRLFKQAPLLPAQYRSRLPANGIINVPLDCNINPMDYDHYIDMFCDSDLKMYLQNDILVKVDRATMSASIEGREPMLDHRILEFSAQLPYYFKYDGKTKKKILRDIVHDYIPEALMSNRKTGFSIPINRWLKDDLNEYLNDFLSENALRRSGLINEKFAHAQIKLFGMDKFYYKPLIWRLLMFQMWYERWMN
jgi:asparagine synthase (glutamine-hydrolysing)